MKHRQEVLMIRMNIQTHSELASVTCKSKKLRATNHAIERAHIKGLKLPSHLTIEAGQLVELELTGGRPSKLVVRQAQCDTWDRVMVLVPKDPETWLVVTCWLNRSTDNHKTLNLNRISA
jgi:hypothetical protein